MSVLKTGLLISVHTATSITAGALVGGGSGMTMALLITFVMNVATYWFSDKIVLKIYGTRL